MDGIREDKRILYLLMLSVVFLIRDSYCFIYSSITLLCVVMIAGRHFELDLGDILLFHSSYWYVVSRIVDPPWAFARALGFVAIYQFGKRSIDSDKHISPACVIVPASALLFKGLIDYSALFKNGVSEIERSWPDWGGNVLSGSEHEYYLVLMASLLIYFVYYTVKINKTGFIGVVISFGATILAMYAKGRLAFWSCVIAALIVGIGIVIENGLYKLKSFRVIGLSIIVVGAVVITLFCTNTFGLYDSYKNSMWTEEGGPIYNTRFDMMGQQIYYMYESYLGNPELVEDDPALVNDEGEEQYYVSNSWLQIGRKKGPYTMFWTMAFSIYIVVYLIKAWIRSEDKNKYMVIAAFVGISFLNMIEPVITNNVRFWALLVYLSGMVRALYNGADLARTWSEDIDIKYV